MCGRFALKVTSADLENNFKVKIPQEFQYNSYNIAPSQEIPVIHLNDDQETVLSSMEWGLLPSWASNKKYTPRPINARLENIIEKPMFRTLFKEKRCLVPASGFYEWDQETRPKQPYYFYIPECPVFAFAGLWNIWQREKSTILSVTLITKEARQPVSLIHDRMPFIVDNTYYEEWLIKGELRETTMPLKNHKISLSVNSPLNNTEELIKAII